MHHLKNQWKTNLYHTLNRWPLCRSKMKIRGIKNSIQRFSIIKSQVLPKRKRFHHILILLGKKLVHLRLIFLKNLLRVQLVQVCLVNLYSEVVLLDSQKRLSLTRKNNSKLLLFKRLIVVQEVPQN